LLRHYLIAQLQLDHVTRNAHLIYGRPPQRRPQSNPTVAEDAGAPKLADIHTFICEFFYGHTTAALAR
jgi:hypothetical protein